MLCWLASESSRSCELEIIHLVGGALEEDDGAGAEGGSPQLVGFPSVYGGKVRPQWLGLDIYSQVLKVFSVKNSSRDDLDHPVGGALPLITTPLSLKVLPSIDSKRKSRAKKTQPKFRENGPESKKRQFAEDSAPGDSAAGHFWTQMEDYFREVTTSDIQLLFPTTDSYLAEDCTVSDPCLLISPLGCHYTKKWAEEDAQEAEIATHQVSTRVKRKIVGSTSASKKSKKVSGEVITTIISPPPENEDEEELCHVCNGGDSDESNAILFCDVCNVAVHQDCYGVRSVPEGQWLCSWCSWKATRLAESFTRKCMLCPLLGGALKPVAEVDSNVSVVPKVLKFAHLFCSQWVPETYIGNMEAMEPIRNVDGVRDERWRLLCSVCKERRGACIQCSHGMCATAFHPLCARDAKHYMEVSSRQNSEDVDLRAYCAKHSASRLAKVYSAGEDGSNVQAKTSGDAELAGKSDDSGLLADSSISEGKTSVVRKRSEERASTFGAALLVQNSDGMNLPYNQPLVDHIHSDSKPSQLPTVTVAEMDIDHESVEAVKVLDNSRVTLCSSAVAELLEFSNQLNDHKQGMEQGILTGASPSRQSLEAFESSDPEVTRSRLDVAALTAELPRKGEVCSNLSTSALNIVRQDSAPTSEDSRGQPEVSGIRMGNGSAEVSTPWDTKGSEERRQRGMSGEASTSHSLATSPSDSPAITPPVSTSPSYHELNEKEAPAVGTSVKLSESTCVSMPCTKGDTCTSELDIADTVEKPSMGNVEKVCRKSLRQCTVRADIGKLSIANDCKMNPWSGAYTTEPQAESSLKVSENMNVTNVSLLENGAHSSLPVKVEEVEHCQNQGLSQTVGMGMIGNYTKVCEANEVDQKCVSTFQTITSSDTSEEVSQTEAINAHSHQVESSMKTDYHVPQAYTHPHVLKLMEGYQHMRNLKRNLKVCTTTGSDCHLETESSSTALSHPGSVTEFVNKESEESIKKQWEQLEVAEREGVLKLAPTDEIEGELLVLQDALLSCARENRGRCELLISNLIQQVAEERPLFQRREQELAFVHNYLSQAREVKKQGRKERRDKEAQALLAAATAAAAASPRVGYIKRDVATNFDPDSLFLMPLLESSIGHNPGLFSSSLRHSKPPVPKPIKPLITSVGVPALSGRSGSIARSNLFKLMVSPKLGGLRTGSQSLQTQGDTFICDICSSGETSRANRIVTCDICKVSVHQECYGIGRIQFGVWLCQPCTELQRRSHNLRLAEADVQTKFWVQCALCFGQRGAFKRSMDNRWVHVFCAQWMPGTFVGLDQAALIQGLENVAPDRFSLLCSICQKEEGACLTCNFGHCHGAFHPTCAREAGFYMSVRVGASGQLQYRAYCDRHSPAQRAKDDQAEEKQRISTEELHTLREIRVEFERVRLICERICRRERLKRDFLQASKDVSIAHLKYAGQSDVNDLEQPVTTENIATRRGSFLSNVQYNTSNATEDQIADFKYRVESNELLKRHKKFRKVGKQHGGTRLLREKLMTPIEASLQNMRLPKGYAYVPVDVYVKGTIATDLLQKPQVRPASVPSHLPDVC